MSKKLHGAYDTESEVIKTVNRLRHDGYSAEEIMLVANEAKKTSIIETQTSMKVEKNPSVKKEEEQKFWKKIKSKFKKEDNAEHSDGFTERFMDLGIPETEAKEYTDLVHQNKILVLAVEKSYHADQQDTDTARKTPEPH